MHQSIDYWLKHETNHVEFNNFCIFVHSIEDAKQKSEHDKMMKLAEEKKRSVRHTIQGFRHEFKKLLEKNHELPPHLRLDR